MTSYTYQLMFLLTTQVQYKVSGFLEKNKDSLPESVVGAVKYSSIRLIRTLFMRGSEHTTGSNIRKNALLKR